MRCESLNKSNAIFQARRKRTSAFFALLLWISILRLTPSLPSKQYSILSSLPYLQFSLWCQNVYEKTYNQCQQNTPLKVSKNTAVPWKHLESHPAPLLMRLFQFCRHDCYWNLQKPHYPTHSYWPVFASPALTETFLYSTLTQGLVTTVGERVTTPPLKPMSSVRSKLCSLCGCVCVSHTISSDSKPYSS